MTIKHSIIHQITRTTDSSEIQIKYSDDENSKEGADVSLFTQFKQSVQRSAQRQYGWFDPEQTDNPLPGWLKKFSSQELGFTTLTKKTNGATKTLRTGN